MTAPDSVQSRGPGAGVPPVDVRVTAGTAWLDQTEPDWRNSIDPAALDMGDCHMCILGQVFGSYWDAGPLRQVGMFDCGPTSASADRWAVAHGFQPYYGPPGAEADLSDSEALVWAWSAEVRQGWS